MRLYAVLPAVIALEKRCYTTPWSAWFFFVANYVLRRHAGLQQNDEIVGYGIVRFQQNWEHIMNLCIAKAYRRHGLGLRMMKHLLSVARSCGAYRAWLEVRPNNHPAIKLYECLGF